MLAIILGLAAAFNFLIILREIRTGRYFTATLDFILLSTLTWWFSGSLGGQMIATVASVVVSLSLLSDPVEDDLKKAFSDEDEEPSSQFNSNIGAVS